jgi:hypothetical protein
MTQFQVTPIKDGVRTHTEMSKAFKKRIEAISKESKVPQSVVLNSLLARALTGDKPAKTDAAPAMKTRTKK